MRVAQVTCLYPPAHLGGAPQQCRQIATGLAARGHQVSVFTGQMDASRPELELTEHAVDGIPVTQVVTTTGFPEQVEANWRRSDVEPFFERFLAAHRPEVVHFHSIQSLGASLLDCAARSGAAVVVTMHDLWWVCQRQFCVDRGHQACIPALAPGSCQCESGSGALWKRRRYLDERLAHARLVLTPSAAMVDRLRMAGLDHEVQVDPNGIPPAAIGAARTPRQRAPGELKLLFAGGSHPMKGIQVLVPALQRLAGLGLDVSAAGYGLEPASPATRRLIGRAPLHPRPPYAPDEIDLAYAGADALVLPSVMFESSSRAVREALVRGVPVVATETGGPEEVVEHGVNGLLVPAGDAEALAAALARLASEPGLLERLASGGVRGEVPAPEAQVAGLESRYRALLPAPPAPPKARSAPARAVYLCGIEGAPLRYRAHHPVEQLSLRGVEVQVWHHADPRADADLAAADVVVVYRAPATAELVARIRRLRARGVPVVFDVDDLIFDPELARQLPNLSTLTEAARRLWVEGVERYRATLLECGRGMASTPEIVARMEALGIPARVHPNGVSTPLAVASEAARRTRPPREGRFRIGYFSGTDTHDHDLATAAPALADFLRANPDATLALGGLMTTPPELGPLADQVERLPFVPWHRHPRRLAALDVNLAPLAPGPFNDAKSSIKWAEAALVDVPTLASPRAAFRESIVDGKTGWLAEAESWAPVLQRLHDDLDAARRAGREARRTVYREQSPWVLGERLLASLASLAATSPAPTPETDPGRWPSESAPHVLEPPGLWPAGPWPVAKAAPGPRVGPDPVSFALDAGSGPLRRLDVLVATFRAQPQAGLEVTLTDRRGREASASVAAGALADNAWAAFGFDPPVTLAATATARLSARGPSGVSPWLAAAGTHALAGRKSPGAVIHRSFHQPPVPPDLPVDIDGAAPPDLGPVAALRLRVRASGSRARTILLDEGPLRGGGRIIRAVGRRALDRMRA